MSALVRRSASGCGSTRRSGIGPNKLVAKVASDAEKPRGFVVLTREQAARRFALDPPRLIPGVGPKTAERLGAIGIETIGDLQAHSVDDLVRRFGPSHGRGLHQRAHFRDDSPVARRRAKSRSVETTFDHDIADPGRLERTLHRAGASAGGRARGAGSRRTDDRDQGQARRLDHRHQGPDARSPDRPGAGDRGDRRLVAPRLRSAPPGAFARSQGRFLFDGRARGRARRRAAQPAAGRLSPTHQRLVTTFLRV